MDHRDIRDFNPIDPDIAKGKGKGKGNQLTKVKVRAKKDKVKDKAKEKANLKAKKNVLPPLLLPCMPQQPKGKAKNNSTPHLSHYLFSFLFFCCIAELAIKPCRSSRSKLRGEFGIPRHLQNRKQKHNKATKKQQNKQKTKNRQVLECETRGEKRVKRPKRPNALICRTPGGSMRYP